MSFGDTLKPVPYLSTMVRDAWTRQRRHQGGAKYNFVTVEGGGFATAADSLCAGKETVFRMVK